jgi:hypothetical protein
MAPPPRTQTRSNEANIQLTISALDRKQFNTKRSAINTFNVPQLTLRD